MGANAVRGTTWAAGRESPCKKKSASRLAHFGSRVAASGTAGAGTQSFRVTNSPLTRCHLKARGKPGRERSLLGIAQ
ncbi:hypothetical protein B0G77_8679 [Paraburkholderia sp. BL10I2N1]|nr:hypothetical protein B0G77_8679 [Paraburkholderia sp. BL10I2N1]